MISPTFTEVPVDMRRGALGRRAACNDGDKMYVLTSESLARMSFSEGGPPFIGDHIKPLTDSIKPLHRCSPSSTWT